MEGIEHAYQPFHCSLVLHGFYICGFRHHDAVLHYTFSYGKLRNGEATPVYVCMMKTNQQQPIPALAATRIMDVCKQMDESKKPGRW